MACMAGGLKTGGACGNVYDSACLFLTCLFLISCKWKTVLGKENFMVIFKTRNGESGNGTGNGTRKARTLKPGTRKAGIFKTRTRKAGSLKPGTRKAGIFKTRNL